MISKNEFPAYVVARKVLQDLVQAYKNNKPYFLSDTVNYMFTNEEDALFIENEDILKTVKKYLSDDYTLQIEHILRDFSDKAEVLFTEEDWREIKNIDEKNKLIYADIELKLIKNN